MLSKLLSGLSWIVFCTLLLLGPEMLAQATVHVGPGQTYTTIQAGIDAANNGDTVLVAPGTYNENIDFKGKAITVTSSGGAAATIIDGGSVGPAVTFKTGETSASTISGFTIQHGGTFNTNGTPVAGSTGGILLQNSSPTIASNIITLSMCWGIASNASAALIENNTISATQDPHGNCSFGGGAAILIWGGMSGDTNSLNGGIIIGNTIENNVESGTEDAGGNGGAAIAVWGGAVLIMNNVLRNNASPGGSGGAINFVSSGYSVVAQNLIYGNSAGCGGGAIATDGGPLLIMNNTIVDNTYDANGGGSSTCAEIAQIYPDPLAYGTDSPSDVFINNIISGSTSYPAVNCSWFNPLTAAYQPTFENDILYNAGGPFFGSYCIDVSGQDNNIVADAQFVDPVNGDYHLKNPSPAIDAGQNSVLQSFLAATGMSLTTDLDGKPRVQDATGKGCTIDIGAYEYPGNSSDCGPTETLKSSLNPAMAGQSVTFTAQLSDSSGTPTGSIQFLDGATLLSTQTVSGTGSAAFTTSSLAVGSHTINANYEPTGNFGASSASLVEVINGDPTNATLTCLPNPIDIGKSAQFTATVTSADGTPMGSVAFTDNGASIGTNALAGGTTSLTYTGSAAGTHQIVATYAPTGPFAASSATCSEVVNDLPTVSTLSIAPVASIYGTPVTLTATVQPATLPGPSAVTGVVTFYNGGGAVGTGTVSGGTATFTTDSLPAGTDNLTCTYGGSSIYGASNCNSKGAIIQPAPTALTLSASSNPAPYLTAVTFNAGLTVNGKPAPAGNTIHISINGQTIGLTTDASGSATYTISTLPPGRYPVTISFAATDSLLASSASLTEVITAAPTSISLTSAPNPGDLNQPVSLTANVSAQSTVGNGNVTFYDGPSALGSAPVSPAGAAMLTASFSTLGVHNLTAVFNGDTDFSASTSAIFAETIIAGDFTVSATPGTASMYTGQAATVGIAIASLHGFDQSVALTCSNLPANTSCSFSPATLPQGQGAAKLVIQTTAPHASSAASVSVLGLLTLLLLPGRRRRRLLTGCCAVLLLVGVALGMSGCGSPKTIIGGTPPGTYNISVVATGTSVTHSAVVTLTVESLF